MSELSEGPRENIIIFGRFMSEFERSGGLPRHNLPHGFTRFPLQMIIDGQATLQRIQYSTEKLDANDFAPLSILFFIGRNFQTCMPPVVNIARLGRQCLQKRIGNALPAGVRSLES